MAGSISSYETASGRRYRARYRKPDGSPTDKRGFTTKRDAQLFLATVAVSKAKDDFIDPTLAKRTVGQLAERWKSGRLAGLKPSSQVVMETSWRVHVEPRWSGRRVGSIKSSEIEDWVAELGKSKKPQTVRRAAFVLSSILTIAERDRLISRSPMIGVSLPAKTRKPPRYLTHAQVEAFAEASPKPDLIRFLAYTGLRWGEMAALRVHHIDIDRARIRVEENVVLLKGEYVTGTPKSGMRREVPMPLFLTPALADLMTGKARDDYLFGDGQVPIRLPNARDGWFYYAVRRAQRGDSSFPTITPHDLRHSAASLAIQAGAHAKAVQRMLGHASAAMTMDVYADLFESDLDVVAQKMSEARESELET